jgi:hypothetical protein
MFLTGSDMTVGENARLRFTTTSIQARIEPPSAARQLQYPRCQL